MTEEIRKRQTADDATSVAPYGEQGITGGARDGAERSTPEINRHLYENLVRNVESQIEYLIGRQPVRQTAR